MGFMYESDSRDKTGDGAEVIVESYIRRSVLYNGAATGSSSVFGLFPR